MRKKEIVCVLKAEIANFIGKSVDFAHFDAANLGILCFANVREVTINKSFNESFREILSFSKNWELMMIGKRVFPNTL